MSWTDERVEQLTKLWADGFSASQIAAQMGGVSRNAVIGKVHRLHLPGRAKSGGSRTPRAKRPATATTRTYASRAGTSSAPRSPSPRGGGSGAATALNTAVDAVAFQEIDIRAVKDVVVPISKKLKLVELGENTCKWPLGDPMTTEFHFCGNDSSDAAPYCTYHSKLAYQPTSERRRAR